MAKPLLAHDLWSLIVPLLPSRPPRRYMHPGHKPVDDRVALTGCHRPRIPDRGAMGAILLSLRTGMHWGTLDATGLCSRSTAAHSTSRAARSTSATLQPK